MTMVETARAVDDGVISGPQPEALGHILQLIYGRFAGQMVCLAAKLGIADQIAAGADTTQALAAMHGADVNSLRRFLRALGANGILAEDGADRWRLTAAGELLRDRVSGSLRNLARLFAAPEHVQSWMALEHSVVTGGCAFNHVHGTDAWTYAQQHPALNDIFNAP